MINFEIMGLKYLVNEIEMQKWMLLAIERNGLEFNESLSDVVSEPIRDRMRGWFGEVGLEMALRYEWPAVENRIKLFLKRMEKSEFNNKDLQFEIQAIDDAINDGLKGQFIYRYPSDKARVFRDWKKDWKIATDKFPDCAIDIRAGVDLWALGHGTASVFHMMRVLEYGISALAENVGKRYDSQMWHTIISQIESAISKEQDKPKSADKKARLQFLSEAATQLRYFKDGWRNYVSHNKCTYDEDQAKRIMNHTHDFMTILATHISEEDVQISTQKSD